MGTLYIGATSNLINRICQHKNGTFSGFTKKYQVTQLVYYEEHQTLIEMARRERRLKNWKREWKIDLIKKFNPTWRDLYLDICSG